MTHRCLEPSNLTDALRNMLSATDGIVNSEGREVDLDALYEARCDARAAITEERES